MQLAVTWASIDLLPILVEAVGRYARLVTLPTYIARAIATTALGRRNVVGVPGLCPMHWTHRFPCQVCPPHWSPLQSESEEYCASVTTYLCNSASSRAIPKSSAAFQENPARRMVVALLRM